MADMMIFPNTVEEFMEQYKVVDTEHVYTNGTEFVPIFRMKQWFEHLPSAQPERKKGKWLVDEDGNMECPFCGNTCGFGNYCNECGADLRGESND